MRFDRTDFDTVVQALREKTPLTVTGDLVRSGARYELQRPRQVSFMPETADADIDSA